MESVTNNKLHSAKIISKKEIVQDTIEFKIKILSKFDFIPGQYIWLQLIDFEGEDGKGDRRAFSIASAPNENDEIFIICRKSNSSFNKKFFSLKEGADVNVIGPFGFSFRLPTDDKPLVCVGGGSGIAPFMSILSYLENKKIKRKITLVNNNENNQKSFYHDELDQFSKNNDSLKIINVFGRVTGDDFDNIDNIKDSVVLVSGPQGFVDSIYEILISKGVGINNIRFENYYPKNNLDENLDLFFENGVPRMTDIDSESFKSRINLFYKLINSSASHTVVTDINGKIIFANKAAENITGYKVSEMIGNTPRLWGGLMSEEFYKELWRAKMSGEVINTKVTNRRKNNELYTASAHISPIKNNKGQIVGFIATEEDITEILNNEKKLLERTEYAEKLNRLTVDRELKMIELKNRIKELEDKNK